MELGISNPSRIFWLLTIQQNRHEDNLIFRTTTKPQSKHTVTEMQYIKVFWTSPR